MNSSNSSVPGRVQLPSVDRMLKHPGLITCVTAYGRSPATQALRHVLEDIRGGLAKNLTPPVDEDVIAAAVSSALERAMAPLLRSVHNLTGTVLHTNLGRAPLPQEALDAIVAVASGACNLEFDLETGKRGDRDTHLEALLAELAGAEAVTVVNNNAAAVLLTLASLAPRKEVILSRGELIEIGGAFRMPDIMKRAGCMLHEIGTTNRTHVQDYRDAISARTGALMKVHTSNYSVQGFTATASEEQIAAMAQDAGIPFIVDLGAGALVDFRQYGLPYEPTVQQTLAAGADIVTFSGDKLLGGPQAGLIAGRRELIEKIRKNPLKRALRCDKMTIAALESVLRLHMDPERLALRLPALALLSRKKEDILAQARRILPQVEACLGKIAMIELRECMSQIGSGSLPVETLPSIALEFRQKDIKKSSGSWLAALAKAFRALPVPVIGRVEKNAFVLDLRCLKDESQFVTQLGQLSFSAGPQQ